MWITPLDPAANLQEILSIEEQVELHQENAIGKIYTVGDSADHVARVFFSGNYEYDEISFYDYIRLDDKTKIILSRPYLIL